MKPVSVIFLIVSGILIIVGLLVCSIAMVQSNNQNVDGAAWCAFGLLFLAYC